jgi:hypothetical protein
MKSADQLSAKVTIRTLAKSKESAVPIKLNRLIGLGDGPLARQ